MSEALSNDAVNPDAISPIGHSEPERAIPDLPTEAITTVTAQPELAPELVTVAQPADEVLHVELASVSAAPLAGPQAEAVADAQPASIVARELSEVATPEAPIVEEAASLPTVAALDAQSAAAPVLGAEAVTASAAAISPVEFDSLDQIMAQSEAVPSEAVPVAEVVAVAVEPAGGGQEIVAERVIAQVIPVASDVVPATPSVASAALFPDLAAATASISRTSSSAGRLMLIAIVVLLLLAAGVIAFLMLNGTNPLAQFGL